MSILIVHIDVPPSGELEVTGDGSSPTDEQMAEETAARERILDALQPYLSSLPERPPHRSGNVSRVQLLGEDTWSNMNHYAAIVTVDIGDPGLKEGLLGVLPDGSTVDVKGGFGDLEEWPASTEGP
jgi:hypothetical protein